MMSEKSFLVEEPMGSMLMPKCIWTGADEKSASEIWKKKVGDVMRCNS